VSIGLSLHLAIIESVIATKFDPTDLKPDQKIRVIDDAALVRLGISDPQSGFAPLIHALISIRSTAVSKVPRQVIELKRDGFV
jgi:hypothetical protein